MNKIEVVEFPFDKTAFPPSLYGGKPYRVCNTGLKMPRVLKEEVGWLVFKYLDTFEFGQERAYLRLDFFVDPNLEEIHLLEINSRLVDGWATGFTLSRAAGQNGSDVFADSLNAQFPAAWHLPESNKAYRKDFDFTLCELKKLGVDVFEIEDIGTQRPGEWVYYYGWDRPPKDRSRPIAPLGGYEHENKIHLARFSREWQGKGVKVPRGYWVSNRYAMPDAWEDIPRDTVVFKFCEKHSEDSERARTSVLYPNEVGKGRFVKQCYARGTIVAQDVVPTLEANGKICQLILLTDSHAVITGYVLWAPRDTRIITDAYEHGPIIWE